MDEIQFADGFDRPDRLAFGLGAGPLVVVVAGVLIAYALVRSPLPGALSAPMALMVAGAAAGLGWLRVGGRPALDWALFAVRYAARPRRGLFTVAAHQSTRDDTPSASAPPRSLAPAPPGRRPHSRVIPLRPFERDARSTPGPTRAAASVITLRDQVATVAPIPAAGTVEIGAAWLPPAAPRARGARRISFFSLKGGTGRSTLATELACLLAADVPAAAHDWSPLRVALLDLDLRSASISVRLGVTHTTVVEYALCAPDERRLDDYLCVHPSGVHVLLGPTKPIAAAWPVTPLLVRELLRDLDVAGYDVVVIDLAPELSPLAATVLGASDDVLVVVGASAGGIQDAYRSTEQLRRIGVRHQLRYVVNRSRTDIDLAETIGDLGGHILAEIPDDSAFTEAENLHRPAGLHTRGAAATALRRLAARVRAEAACAG